MKEHMEDGENEFTDRVLLPTSDSSTNVQPSISVDSFLDDFLRNSQQTCTHTHTCNPPGPDAAHTHTCYHTHTRIVPSDEDITPRDNQSPDSKPRRPVGNREAVRKYREKKKAHAAYLEEEVKKLRFVNQELMKKVQKQAVLESEISRLRGLLVDLGGKIDNELGDFPFVKKCGGISTLRGGECGFRPTNVNDLACGLGGASVIPSTCQPALVDCRANTNCVESAEKHLLDSLGNLVSSAPPEE